MPGRVCSRHERYVPEGEDCPYCEPEPVARSSGAFFVPGGVADRTKLDHRYALIEPGDTLNGRRVWCVEDEADGVMVHLEPAPASAVRLHPLPPSIAEQLKRDMDRDEPAIHFRVNGIDAADVLRVVSSPAFREAMKAYKRDIIEGTAPKDAPRPVGVLILDKPVDAAAIERVKRLWENLSVMRARRYGKTAAAEAALERSMYEGSGKFEASWDPAAVAALQAPHKTMCRCGAGWYVPPDNAWLDPVSGRLHTAQRC